ncbi:MAG: hypothetical protein JNL79_00665 [Myxococcales bacterium]|nr:hypothetical protein [Myxococcales bacterium]
MEERSPPVAVRVVRPFADEQSLLDAEVGAFSRTGIVLIGAPSRPNGVVLRFEVCLRDGTAVMRGEGRVVGYRAPTAQEEGALMLRFTRLDVKSKSLLDRAVALREERRSLPPPPPKEPARAESEEAPPPSLPPPSLPPRATASVAPRVALPSVAPVMTHAAASDGEPEPVAMPAPAPAATTMDVTDEDVEEIDDADIASADPNDLTEQVPPVAETPAPVPADETAEPAHEPEPVEPPHEPEPVESPHEPEPVEPPHEPEPVEPPREPEPIAAVVSAPRDGSSLVRLARGKPFASALAPETRDAALDRLRARRRR